MNPALQNFLLSLVRIVLQRNNGNNLIDAAALDDPQTASLQSLGYIRADKHLSEEAFLKYFELVPALEPPPDVTAWCSDFNLTGVKWKRATGVLKNTSRAFVALNVVVIRTGSRPSAWFHEMAHLVFSRISRPLVEKLMKATSIYPRVYSDGLTETVADPDTGRKAILPKGLYLNMNRLYCGLDHSGKEYEDDELWASLFAQYCCQLPLEDGVCSVLDEIIDSLRSSNQDRLR